MGHSGSRGRQKRCRLQQGGGLQPAGGASVVHGSRSTNLPTGVAQFEASRYGSRTIVEGEKDSGDRHFQITVRPRSAKLGRHRCGRRHPRGLPEGPEPLNGIEIVRLSDPCRRGL